MALAASLAALTVPVTPHAVAASQPLTGSQPNIIILMLDDMGALDDRILERLPNIRQTFLEHGTRFTQFFGETSLCCPGRVGFLTGQHTHHHGVVRNDASLFDPTMSLATQLQSVGYNTMLIGKYLNKYDRIAPAEPPGWDRFQALVPGDTSYAGYYNYDLWINGSPTPKHFGSTPIAYSTDVVRYRARRGVRLAPVDKPIFAWLAPFAAHGPTIPAERYQYDSRCTGIPPWSPPNYNEADVSDKPAYVQAKPLMASSGVSLARTCRTMLAVDYLVGVIRSELAAAGRLDDTIFILTSDNGMNLGSHRLSAKSAPYATQIPFFMSWPAILGHGPSTVTEMLSNIDVAPTLCEFAGCTMGPYPNGQTSPDGTSFADLLLGTADTLGRDAILQSSPHRSINLDMPPWYGLRTTPQSPLASVGCAAAETGGCLWHFARYENGDRELYDDSNGPCWLWVEGQPGDPCELTNLVGDPSYDELRAALADRLDRLIEDFPVTPP